MYVFSPPLGEGISANADAEYGRTGMKKAEMCKKQAEGRKIRIKIERKLQKP
jgi:hypothetical protein